MTSYRADKEVIDTHTQTQATTIPGGQNWPRVIKMVEMPLTQGKGRVIHKNVAL